MSFLGVDMGIRRIAIANAAAATVSMWSTKDSTPITVILPDVVAWARGEARQLDIIAVEQPLVAGVRNLQSSLKVAMVTGALMAGLGSQTTCIVPVAVSTWKKDICGHGGLDKPGVASWLYEHHPALHAEALEWGRYRQDVIDAFCVSLWAAVAAPGKLGGVEPV